MYQKISEIEDLVSVINSEAVRNQTRLNLLFKLVYDEEGKIKIPNQYVDDIISYCQRKSDELEGRCENREQGALLTYAARVAKHARRTEQAKELYEKAINFNAEKEYPLIAAKIADEAGFAMKSRELYDKIILSYEEKKDFVSAARIAEEAGMSERANAYRALQDRLRTMPEYLKR